MSILLKAVGQAPELVGVDIGPQEVARAREFGIYSALHVTSADTIPEPNAAFDWAFEGTLAEVARVLRPDGRFILTVPSSEFRACLRGPLRGSRARYLAEIDRRLAHLRYWTYAEWRSTLSCHGFAMETCTGHLSRSWVRRWEAISGLTAGILYRLSGRPPIEIQRDLGLRRGQRLARGLAVAAAHLLVANARRAGRAPQGFRYIVAQRLER